LAESTCFPDIENVLQMLIRSGEAEKMLVPHQSKGQPVLFNGDMVGHGAWQTRPGPSWRSILGPNSIFNFPFVSDACSFSVTGSNASVVPSLHRDGIVCDLQWLVRESAASPILKWGRRCRSSCDRFLTTFYRQVFCLHSNSAPHLGSLSTSGDLQAATTSPRFQGYYC
jgi:hypothetical protein